MSISKIELDWAVQQLEALGYIEQSRDGTGIAITARGKEKAREIALSHPICDRILLMLFYGEVGKFTTEEEPQGS